MASYFDLWVLLSALIKYVSSFTALFWLLSTYFIGRRLITLLLWKIPNGILFLSVKRFLLVGWEMSLKFKAKILVLFFSKAMLGAWRDGSENILHFWNVWMRQMQQDVWQSMHSDLRIRCSWSSCSDNLENQSFLLSALLRSFDVGKLYVSVQLRN